MTVNVRTQVKIVDMLGGDELDARLVALGTECEDTCAACCQPLARRLGVAFDDALNTVICLPCAEAGVTEGMLVVKN